MRAVKRGTTPLRDDEMCSVTMELFGEPISLNKERFGRSTKLLIGHGSSNGPDAA
jgi:hypothetical protein